MSNKITVSPDKDGRYIIHLFGKDIEIDESMFVDGVATIKQFGDEYIVVKADKKKAKKAKKEADTVAEESSESSEGVSTEAEE